MEANGWIKLLRTPAIYELLRYKNAFVLLTIIALRARRTANEQLKTGEAFIGDYAEYGLTERQYRTAKLVLQKRGIATFKGTPRGTIARLTDGHIYDINPDADGQIEQRTKDKPADEQATTNKNEKKDNNNEKNIYTQTSSSSQNGLKGSSNARIYPSSSGRRTSRRDTEYRQSEQYPNCLTI